MAYFFKLLCYKLEAVIVPALCENKNSYYRHCDLVFSEILPQLQTQDDVETLKSHDIAYM